MIMNPVSNASGYVLMAQKKRPYRASWKTIISRPILVAAFFSAIRQNHKDSNDQLYTLA
jgi:hypothetical protein